MTKRAKALHNTEKKERCPSLPQVLPTKCYATAIHSPKSPLKLVRVQPPKTLSEHPVSNIELPVQPEQAQQMKT